MSLKNVILFLVLLNAGTSVVFGTHTREHQRLFDDLNPQKPRLEFESDGGRLETWGGRGSGVFEDANVAACRVTLKSRGLWIPSYVDAPTLHVVIQGAGRVGIISPLSDRHTQKNTFKVIEGDVVAVREGDILWWYNDEDQDLEIVGAADVTQSSRTASLRAFHLAGAREEQQGEDEQEQAGYGGIIHGFSKEVLARAWEMDKESLRELLKSQTERGIIRLDEHITFRDSLDSQEQSNIYFQSFIYRLAKVHPDLRVENGGEVRELSSHKLPILKSLGLGLECMKLEQNAMVAPNWFHNAHQVLYVVSGRGRIEVVRHNGEKALDTDLEEGSLVVIPAFFPSTKIASRSENFHYNSFITSDRPGVSFLAGRNSVYQGIPLRVLSRMLNVDEDQARQVRVAHEKQTVIFAPAGEHEMARHAAL